MVRRTVLGVIFVSGFALASSAYAGKMELTTYYPSPSGEYKDLQSKGACVGENCSSADVVSNKLMVKGNGEVGGDMTITGNTTANSNLTVQGKTRVGGAGAKGFVIQRGTPTSPEDGQLWIE